MAILLDCRLIAVASRDGPGERGTIVARSAPHVNVMIGLSSRGVPSRSWHVHGRFLIGSGPRGRQGWKTTVPTYRAHLHRSTRLLHPRPWSDIDLTATHDGTVFPRLCVDVQRYSTVLLPTNLGSLHFFLPKGWKATVRKFGQRLSRPCMPPGRHSVSQFRARFHIIRNSKLRSQSQEGGAHSRAHQSKRRLGVEHLLPRILSTRSVFERQMNRAPDEPSASVSLNVISFFDVLQT